MQKAKVAGAFGVCDSVTLSLHIQTNRFRFVGLEGEGLEGDRDASESNGLSSNSSEKRYSSITCSGGTQLIPWKMQVIYADRPQPRSNYVAVDGHKREECCLPPAAASRERVCKLHDVCWTGGKLVYFENPALLDGVPRHAHLRHLEGLVTLGPVQLDPCMNRKDPHTWSPIYVRGHIPEDLPYDAREVHVLDSFSWGNNIAHLMLENILPHLIALSVFDLDAHVPASSLVLTMHNPCRLMEESAATLRCQTAYDQVLNLCV